MLLNSQYSGLNINVFNAVLKLSKVAELRMLNIKLFQAAGPATANALSPNFFLVLCSNLCSGHISAAYCFCLCYCFRQCFAVLPVYEITQLAMTVYFVSWFPATNVINFTLSATTTAAVAAANTTNVLLLLLTYNVIRWRLNFGLWSAKFPWAAPWRAVGSG